MTDSSLFGLDTVFKTIEKDVKRKSDIIMAFVHWNLTKQGFRAIGIGDERTLTGDEEQSELLPSGWNDNDNYTIRYIFQNELYILHGLLSDDSLIINLMRSKDLAVTNIAFNIEDEVKEMSGSVGKMIPNHIELIHKIRTEVVDFFTGKQSKTSQTQTDTQHPPPFTPTDIPPRRPPPTREELREYQEYRELQNVGRSDLDPFNNPLGGGMIYNPFRPDRRDLENPGLGIPGGLPRGSVPPGARFDPFGPLGVGPMPRRGPPPPDADHLPPPGFDHMFM